MYWPDNTVIYRCAEISLGEVNQHISEGNNTLKKLVSNTEMGHQCGSCKTLMSKLFDLQEEVIGYESIGFLSILTIILLLISLSTPNFDYISSIQSTIYKLEITYRNNYYQQLTGYSLFLITLVTLIIT